MYLLETDLKQQEMKCTEVEALMIDYLDNKLEAEQTGQIEKHLETCEICLDELLGIQEVLGQISKEEMAKPDDSLRINFYHMLHNEIKKRESSRVNQDKQFHMRWFDRGVYRVAAGIALLVTGTFLGMLIYSLISNSGQSSEISELRSEVTALRKNAMLTMLKDESSSSRIQAVDYAKEIDSPDENIINALVKTLNNDKNINVRMAAAYALAKFTSQRSVCDSLVKSLSLQKDPILQVTLINILVEIQEKSAIRPIEQIISSSKTMPEVKTVAENGVKMLI
jgi:hypothetical protein